MFSICFQSDQDLFTDARSKKKMKRILILPMPDPRTKASGQLVGLADYMGVSLEVNDNHTMQSFQTYRWNI